MALCNTNSCFCGYHTFASENTFDCILAGIMFARFIQNVTHKNTVAGIVIYRQDVRGRFPVFGVSSPNVGQTHNKNPKRVRKLEFLYVFYMR